MIGSDCSGILFVCNNPIVLTEKSMLSHCHVLNVCPEISRIYHEQIRERK